MWDAGGLNVAIPKRKGGGYLKVPFGHHPNSKLSAIEVSERVDMCGLDGYLELSYGYTRLERRKQITARVLPQLAKIFGFKTWREDTKLFWRVVTERT